MLCHAGFANRLDTVHILKSELVSPSEIEGVGAASFAGPRIRPIHLVHGIQIGVAYLRPPGRGWLIGCVVLHHHAGYSEGEAPVMSVHDRCRLLDLLKSLKDVIQMPWQ